MKDLLDRYHPDTAALGRAMSAAYRASPAEAQGGSGPRRAALLRVSDESRGKFHKNLDADLDWLTWSPEAAWIKENVANVELFRSGAAGDRARALIGMQPLYARGTTRLIGGWMVHGAWLFVFLLTSAAKADLPRGDNASTEAIKALLLALAHDDPHDTEGRPTVFAHALDRIFRAELYAWQTFETLTQTYVLVNAAGRTFDALQSNGKDEWTLITFGASRGRDDTARRFLVARLNKARAGNWPGNENGLPIGFCASADPDSSGRFNLAPADGERHVSRPVPDPRARWAVQAIAAVYADPHIKSWAAAATGCGARGITSKGIDERGTNLAELSDLTSAGRLLLTPIKIRAYTTGLLAHTETGVTPGQFNPGDGHQLRPLYSGDSLGAVTYDVRLGTPVDHGWDWGVSAATWASILRKFWLPDDFTPDGWRWESDPSSWGWTQILDAAATSPRRTPTGRHAANGRQRPFSGLMRWEAGGHRHLLYCRSDKDTGRYEWRSEPIATARRSRRTGEPYRMQDTDGVPVSSWPVREFHRAWARLAQELLEQLIATDDDLAVQRLTPSPDRNVHEAAAALRERARRRAELHATAEARRADAAAQRRSAAHHRDRGNDRVADKYDQGAEASDSEADTIEAELAALDGAPPPPEPTPMETADFGTPAAALGALTGAYAEGAAPVTLQEALRELGAERTRLTVVDAATVRLTVTVTLRSSAGRPVSRTGSRLIRRSRPARSGDGAAERRQAAKRDLARAWFYDGIGLDELLVRSGNSETNTMRIVREYLATGTIRTVGQAEMEKLAADRLPSQLLRAAITSHPVREARAAVWCALTASDALPEEVSPKWAGLMRDVYRGRGTWGRGPALLDPTADHRADLVTVLRALPDPTARPPAAALAGLLGIDTRHVSVVSRELHRGNLAIPATLTRTETDRRAPGAVTFAVGLPRCPWPDCDSTTADAVLLLPELALGCHSTVLCRECLRPPTRNLRFPDAYRQLIDDQPTRTGSWIRCAGGCKQDLGAGAGLLWRWDDTHARHVTAHPGCANAQDGTNAAIRAWALSQGLPISDRGRIPADIRAAYRDRT